MDGNESTERIGPIMGYFSVVENETIWLTQKAMARLLIVHRTLCQNHKKVILNHASLVVFFIDNVVFAWLR